MTGIMSVEGREVLDSRGNPTVEVEVILESEPSAARWCPPGRPRRERGHRASRRRQGAVRRQGVLKAVNNVNTVIAPEIELMDAVDQIGIDRKMIEIDGTPTKSNLGANAILACRWRWRTRRRKTLGLPLYRYSAAWARSFFRPR